MSVLHVVKINTATFITFNSALQSLALFLSVSQAGKLEGTASETASSLNAARCVYQPQLDASVDAAKFMRTVGIEMWAQRRMTCDPLYRLEKTMSTKAQSAVI